MSKPVIKSVFKFANGMVAVFDENGEQMPEYQGHYDDVRTKIVEDAPDDAEFYGDDAERQVSRAEW